MKDKIQLQWCVDQLGEIDARLQLVTAESIELRKRRASASEQLADMVPLEQAMHFTAVNGALVAIGPKRINHLVRTILIFQRGGDLPGTTS